MKLQHWSLPEQGGSEIMQEPIRVRVVEDEADIAEELRFLLCRRGMEVELVPGWPLPEGAEVQFASGPEVVVIDRFLGGYDGLDYACLLRERCAESREPCPALIMLTGGGSTDLLPALFRLRFDAFILKPVLPRKLGTCIERAAARRRLGLALPENRPQLDLLFRMSRPNLDAFPELRDLAERPMLSNAFRLAECDWQPGSTNT